MMQNNLKNNSAMLNLAEPLVGSADSLIGNQNSSSLKQLDYRAKQQIQQKNNHEKIDKKEHNKADRILNDDLDKMDISSQKELDYFLRNNYLNNSKAKNIAQDYFMRNNSLGISLSQNKLNEHISGLLENNNELSTTDKIKNFTEAIRQGKSQTEILQILVSKFENEEAVSTWVANWRNFLKLHQFAENKSPAEWQAIQHIISKADFTSENSFEDSLTKIAQSTEISTQTKLEISREFDGANVFLVDDMDITLKEVKSHKQQIEKAINTKNQEKESLDSEVKELESEIEKLTLEDPKRQELEERLKQKKEVLKQTVAKINYLEEGKPKDVSFQLREGFSAKLNPDGSRSIKINSVDFAIKLPSNFLPLTGTKNLRSINLAFPYLALNNQSIARFIFSPNLENNNIPNKQNRKMGHLISSTLGIDDTKILSEENIKQLNADLARLTSIPGKSGQECLIELGVFDIASQSLNKKRFVEVLKYVREKRGLRDDMFFAKYKDFHNPDR